MSQLTFRNHIPYAAEFVVNEGHQGIARGPGVAAGAKVSVFAAHTYCVTAAAWLDDRLCTAASLEVSGAVGFRAHGVSRRGYEFDVVQVDSTHGDQLLFQAPIERR